jgi:hypothetical protein
MNKEAFRPVVALFALLQLTLTVCLNLTSSLSASKYSKVSFIHSSLNFVENELWQRQMVE